MPSGPVVTWWGADMPLLVTVSEAARLIRVNKRTIYKLVAAGKLELVRIGPRSQRVTVASLLHLAGVKHNKPAEERLAAR